MIKILHVKKNIYNFFFVWAFIQHEISEYYFVSNLLVVKYT